MQIIRKLAYLWIAAFFLLSPLGSQIARGLTVSDEEKMARSFLKVIYRYYEIIDDPVVADYVSKIGNRV